MSFSKGSVPGWLGARGANSQGSECQEGCDGMVLPAQLGTAGMAGGVC